MAGLGLTALKAADYETAEENLVEARERAPDDPELALALATLRTETGDFGEARALLDETLAADPGHARSLWGLAEVEARAAGARTPRPARTFSRAWRRPRRATWPLSPNSPMRNSRAANSTPPSARWRVCAKSPRTSGPSRARPSRPPKMPSWMATHRRRSASSRTSAPHSRSPRPTRRASKS